MPRGIPRAEAPRSSLQPTCKVCGHAYVKKKGQVCAACKERTRTRQHTLDQARLGGFW